MGNRSSGTVLSDRSLKKKKFFKKSEKPFIRPFTKDDMWILWAAYKEGSFPHMEEMSKEDFYAEISVKSSKYQFLFLVEDNNKKFKAGRGPVCIIGANTDGWKFEPHVDYFKWATKYNMIRTTLCFLNWISFNKDVGVCVIRSLDNTVNLFKYMREYIGLNYVGMMPQGDIRGNEHIFCLLGKKANGLRASSKGLHRTSNGSGDASTSPARGHSDNGEKVPCV